MDIKNHLEKLKSKKWKIMEREQWKFDHVEEQKQKKKKMDKKIKISIIKIWIMNKKEMMLINLLIK